MHPEHPGLGALADHVLRSAEPGREAMLWRWMLERMTAYPAEKLVPALKPPSRPDAPRRLVAVRMATVGDPGAGVPLVQSLSMCSGGAVTRVMLSGRDDAAELVARALFSHANRGALLAFPDGAELAFPTFLRHYARPLIEADFTIEPLTAGATIRALIVRKARHSWMLCDVGVMTGLEGLEERAFVSEFAPPGSLSEPPSRALWRALDGWQALSLEHFGAAASPTVGRSAIRAASRHLGQRQWLWRAHPLAVAMLRGGGGYRGGYAAAHRFRGQAWSADLNKAYTWALGEQLPLRLALSRARPLRLERPGIYLAEVSGTGLAPLYIGAWRDSARGFERVLWHGGETMAVLTLTEAQAVRRLGYTVKLGTGLVYLQTFSFRGFTAAVAGVARLYGRGSPPERIARVYGASAYGKLAERPERQQVMYAAERPGDDWYPFATNTGEEMPDLWTSSTIAHRPHQHVDAASEVTSLVRARLYDAMGAVRRAGGIVPHADTDGFLSSIDPAPLLGESGTDPGLWRVSASSDRALVWGAKGHAYGADVRAAGIRGMTAEQADRVLGGEVETVDMKKRAGAFTTGALYEPLRRQVRAV